MIRFRVAGRPAPQGSKRHVGGGRMVESSQAVGPWREAVRAECQRLHQNSRQRAWETGWPDLHDAVAVALWFALPRPRSHFGTGRNAGKVKDSAPSRPAGKPDLDKLTRAVLDGLTDGGAWADDSQVVNLTAYKNWCPDGMAPGVTIEIEGAL